MSLHAFDTLRFAERLEKAGLTREQAAEFSKALGDFMQAKLVTKEDLQNLATKEELTKLATKSELKEEIKDLRSEMRWLFVAATTVLGLAIKLFH